MKFCIVRLFVVVLAAAMTGAGTMPANFQGIVHDPAGAMLPGAAIIVQRWEWDRTTSHARLISQPPIYTDNEGRFSVHLPPGLYDVFVSFIALEPVAKKFEIKAVTPTNLDCNLELSSVTPTAGGLQIFSESPQSNLRRPTTGPSGGCVDRGP